MSDLHTTTENVLIDERVRGFPPGHPPLSLAAIGKQGWKPYDGRMALPLISLDRQAFADNTELMMIYVKSHGAEIAPHAKTPMSTALGHDGRRHPPGCGPAQGGTAPADPRQ
jgi:D-serine dehydratase